MLHTLVQIGIITVEVLVMYACGYLWITLPRDWELTWRREKSTLRHNVGKNLPDDE